MVVQEEVLMPQVQDAFAHRVTVLEPIWVPMPDGTRLVGKLWLPETAFSGASPVPVLLEYLPYRLRDGMRPQKQTI
jgi:hypothetical protein